MNLDALFPGHSRTAHKPTRDDLPLARFEVVHVSGEPHIYVTQGAAEHGREFAIYSRRPHQGHVDLLTSVAYFQSFYGLERGSTYKYAAGYFPGSTLNRVLVHSRAPLGEEVFWLVPITEDEEKLLKKQGPEVLEKLLEGIDFLQEDRASVE